MPGLHRAALVLICLIWAGNFLASAIAVDHVPPVTVTAMRFLVVLALLFPFLRRPQRGQWLNLLVACWCMGALHFALVFLALKRSTDVSSVAILMQVYVPISTLLAVAILGERIGWRTVSGIALAFCGVLVVGLDPVVLAQLDVLGMVLVSAFFLALGTIFMRRVQGVGLFSFQAWNAAHENGAQCQEEGRNKDQAEYIELSQDNRIQSDDQHAAKRQCNAADRSPADPFAQDRHRKQRRNRHINLHQDGHRGNIGRTLQRQEYQREVKRAHAPAGNKKVQPLSFLRSPEEWKQQCEH